MNNTIILALSTDGSILGFFKKNKEHVDYLEKDCIMPYLQAAELEGKLHHTVKRKLISLSDLLLLDPVKSTVLINELVMRHNQNEPETHQVRQPSRLA